MDGSLTVAALYVAVLVGCFAAVAVWESLAPARAPRAALGGRWRANLGLMAVNQGLLPVLAPISNAGAAWLAAERGWGLMNAHALPPVAAFALTFVALDAARYGLHRLLHAAPVLWRLHRIHHSDVDYDLTLGVRFHPVEAVLTGAASMAIVAALGAPVWAVVGADAVALAFVFFTHGNVRVAPAADRALRRAIVTPALHATHHSVEPDEAMSNYGGVLSVWDRMFGTLRDAPRAGEAIAFGLAEERDAARLGFRRLLAMPFAARAR